MATWPSSLPAPRIVGYGVNPFDPAVRTEMEAGNSKARRRTFSRKDKVPVVWNMTDAQYAIFRTWFDATDGADGGAGWFSVSLLLGGGGMSSVEARFSGVYTAQYVPHLHWDVSATLEAR